MPIPIPEALSDHAALASTKVTASRNLPRFVVSAALAGVFVGVAVVLLLTVTGPLAAAGSPFAKLISGRSVNDQVRAPSAGWPVSIARSGTTRVASGPLPPT